MLTLCDHPLSPYAQKVKIALREKGLAFSATTPAALGSGRSVADFVRANPRGEVPTLLLEGAANADSAIFDSTVILEYLEDAFPTPPLRPDGALDRAHARMLEDVMDTHFEAITWAMSEVRNFGRAEGAEAERLLAAAGREIATWHGWLEGQLGDRPWFNGTTFGWGDLAVVPFLNGAAGFGHPPPLGTRLADWLARANARPSVAATRREAEQIALASAGGGLAAVREAVAQGHFKREYRDHRLEWMVRNGGIDIVRAGLERNNIRFTSPFPATP